MTLESAWLLNIEDFDVGCDTARSAACLSTFRRKLPGGFFYQFKEDETRIFCPKTGVSEFILGDQGGVIK